MLLWWKEFKQDMNRLLFVFIALFFGFTCHSQELPNWTFGASFSSEFAYRWLEAEEEVQWIADLRNSEETVKWAYSTGLSAKRKVISGFYLGTGILFANRGYRTKKDSLVFGDMIDPRYGFVSDPQTDEDVTAYFRYHFYYLDIPLIAAYHFPIGSGSLMVSINPTYSFLLKANNRLVSNVDDLNRTNDYDIDSYTRHNFGIQAQLGYEFSIGKSFGLAFYADGYYPFNNVSDSPLTAYLYSAGVGASLNYHISNKADD